ncbi:endothelial cell-selective adhesion molecule-like [Heterodontus francisci]|uniref:endothelial cell-selective adhesion molecule-like n=1 Tax=Heterodontus francisci TaxID=7792 RepID=UPI00355B84D3
MNAVKLTLWASLLVTLTVFSESARPSLEMPKTQLVSLGNTVVLTSRLPRNLAHLTPFTVIWNKENEGEVILMYSNEIVVEGATYKNRIGFKHLMPNNDVSIYINSTNLSDSGRYICTVHTSIPDFISGATNLSVLVPPSTPKCNHTGNLYVGSNVTLTCRSAIGKPVPTYTWQRITPKPQSFYLSGQNRRMGTLTLTNLSKEMSGLYTCKSVNMAGNASCSIQMNVMIPNNAGIMAGAIIGVFLGMCLIIALIICFCMHQRKRKAEKEEDVANEIKEDAQAPTGNTWAKTGSSDIISKNGTLSSMNSTMHVYKPYPTKPPSDTASTITALGVNSTGSYKRPNNAQRSAGNTPTKRSSGQSPPVYASTVNTHYSASPPKWQNGAQAQAPGQAPTLSSMTPSNLTRMGAVPVMVPAQSQAGSLV